jgi:hypothetical protein
LARFWLLLSRDKSNYPFRGIPAGGLIPLNPDKEIILSARIPRKLLPTKSNLKNKTNFIEEVSLYATAPC